MAVFLCQCLCPKRHCIVAGAIELEGEELEVARAMGVARVLREQVKELTTDGGPMNPLCGMCGAGMETWFYEVARSVFETMEEAEPVLRRMQGEMLATAAGVASGTVH